MANPSGTFSDPLSQNPHFSHVDRAPYELGYLLKNLPADFSAHNPQSPEALLIAEAAVTHATNANDALLCGLEALGKTIFVAGANEENEIDKSDLASLGALIQHMATEMQFLQEIASNLKHAIREHAAAGHKGDK